MTQLSFAKVTKVEEVKLEIISRTLVGEGSK